MTLLWSSSYCCGTRRICWICVIKTKVIPNVACYIFQLFHGTARSTLLHYISDCKWPSFGTRVCYLHGCWLLFSPTLLATSCGEALPAGHEAWAERWGTCSRARASHPTTATPAEAIGLGWAAPLVPGCPGLEALAEWKHWMWFWGCPSPGCLGAWPRRDGGCVHLPAQGLVAQPRGPQQQSFLAAPTQEQEIRSSGESGNPLRCCGPASKPRGGGGVSVKELTPARLKYTMAALLTWPLWVLGAARNNKTTDKGRNPDTVSTKGLFLLQWGKAAFPLSAPQDFLFSKYMNRTQWFSSCPSFLPVPNPSRDFSASLGQKPTRRPSG